MFHITLLSVGCLAVPYFCKLSPKRRDFRKTIIENKMLILIFSTKFVQNISHSSKLLARYYNKYTELFK